MNVYGMYARPVAVRELPYLVCSEGRSGENSMINVRPSDAIDCPSFINACKLKVSRDICLWWRRHWTKIRCHWTVIPVTANCTTHNEAHDLVGGTVSIGSLMSADVSYTAGTLSLTQSRCCQLHHEHFSWLCSYPRNQKSRQQSRSARPSRERECCS